MNKKNVFIVPILSASLLFTGALALPVNQTYAATTQVSVQQKDVNLVATHYAKIEKKVENYLEKGDFEGYVNYLDTELEKENDLKGINADAKAISDLFYDDFAIMYNFGLSAIDYMNGDISETEMQDVTEQMYNEAMDVEEEIINKVEKYKTKYKVTLSSDMLYLLGQEEVTTTYVVKKGDTLYKVATKYQTTVSEVKTLNSLKTDNIKVGQKLKVPNTPVPEPVTYVVKKGDTLYKISKKYNTTVNNLKSLNKLKNDHIKVGQKLIVKK